MQFQVKCFAMIHQTRERGKWREMRSQRRGEPALQEGFPPQATGERVSRLEATGVEMRDRGKTRKQILPCPPCLPSPIAQKVPYYSETLFLARSARASADAMTSSIFSSISPGKFSRTLVERATRPLPSSKSMIIALIG